MSIEQSIWKLGKDFKQLSAATMDSEKELEDIICKDVSLLNDEWLLIGRQVPTDFGKFIDLLAVDVSGSLIIIELKKNRTPREVVAQSIDYASWINKISSEKISEIFKKYADVSGIKINVFDEAFYEKFNCKLGEDEVNNSHQIVIVAVELDASTERIVHYLNDSNIPINVVFFRVFKDGPSRYLSRAWFIDPYETQSIATAPKTSEPWNGEYYVSFGESDDGRNWDDAMRYGFISGGGGRWYSKTLNKLNPGDRVWVNIPRVGYVGVGIVQESPVQIDEFTYKQGKNDKLLLDAKLKGTYGTVSEKGEDKGEYLVKVDWVKAVPRTQAVSELGFFGNQNTVAQPTTPKWNHTIERLKNIFNIK